MWLMLQEESESRQEGSRRCSIPEDAALHGRRKHPLGSKVGCNCKADGQQGGIQVRTGGQSAMRCHCCGDNC